MSHIGESGGKRTELRPKKAEVVLVNFDVRLLEFGSPLSNDLLLKFIHFLLKLVHLGLLFVVELDLGVFAVVLGFVLHLGRRLIQL